jgi:hypothetical protein
MKNEQPPAVPRGEDKATALRLNPAGPSMRRRGGGSAIRQVFTQIR